MEDFIQQLIFSTQAGAKMLETRYQLYMKKTISTIEKEMIESAYKGKTSCTVTVQDFSEDKDLFLDIERHFSKMGIRVTEDSPTSYPKLWINLDWQDLLKGKQKAKITVNKNK